MIDRSVSYNLPLDIFLVQVSGGHAVARDWQQFTDIREISFFLLAIFYSTLYLIIRTGKVCGSGACISLRTFFRLSGVIIPTYYVSAGRLVIPGRGRIARVLRAQWRRRCRGFCLRAPKGSCECSYARSLYMHSEMREEAASHDTFPSIDVTRVV